jgi:hypothetical protein
VKNNNNKKTLKTCKKYVIKIRYSNSDHYLGNSQELKHLNETEFEKNYGSSGTRMS